jgi:hypothetical protein
MIINISCSLRSRKKPKRANANHSTLAYSTAQRTIQYYTMVSHSRELSAPPQLGRVWNVADNAETNSILNMFAQKEKEAASSLVSKQPKLNPMNNNPASTFLDSPVGKMFAPLPQHQQHQHVSAPMTMTAPLTMQMMNTANTVGAPSHTRTPSKTPTFHAPPATAMGLGLGHHNMSMNMNTSANHNKGRHHSRARSEMPASGKGNNYFDLAADGFEQPVSSSFSPVKNDIIASTLNEPLHSSKKHGHGHKKSHSRGRSMDFASMNMNLSTVFHRQAAVSAQVSAQAQTPANSDDVSVMACCEGMLRRHGNGWTSTTTTTTLDASVSECTSCTICCEFDPDRATASNGIAPSRILAHVGLAP